MTSVDINKVCPRCFSKTGQSIVLTKDGDIYKCPNNPEHKFKEEGHFLKKIDKKETI